MIECVSCDLQNELRREGEGGFQGLVGGALLEANLVCMCGWKEVSK